MYKHHQHEELIPYDQDIDISVHISDLTSISDISIRLRTLVLDFGLTKNDFYLVFTPNWTLPYPKRERFNCKGERINVYVDVCSFTDPMARLVYRHGGHIDLYPYYEGDETSFKYLLDRNQKLFKKSDFFPVAKCKYMGFTLRCPKDPRPLLKTLYSSFIPNKICKKGKWIGR